MTESTEVLRVLMGSRLFGTASLGSDYDYKAVTVPGLIDLLLNTGRIQNWTVKPDGVSKNDPMPPGGTEVEYLPIQNLMDDFFDGKVHALEFCFAKAYQYRPIQNMAHAREQRVVSEIIDDLPRRFLTGDLATSGFVAFHLGYFIGKLWGHNEVPEEVKDESKKFYNAIRITEQLIELHLTGGIEFPRKNAEELTRIKLGNFDIDVLPRLLTLKDALDKAVEHTVLPQKTKELEAVFVSWKAARLLELYGVTP